MAGADTRPVSRGPRQKHAQSMQESPVLSAGSSDYSGLMGDAVKAVQRFYDGSYGSQGFGAQRRYPNEELCRFMGRHYFGVPSERRQDVRILELGCGSGANLWMIAREGFSAHGLDLSSEAVSLCARMLESYGAGADLRVGDMTRTGYPDRWFDAVVDVFSSYCLDNQGHAAFLDEIARILKPGGRFFSYTPGQGSDAFKNPGPSEKIDDSTLDGVHRPDAPYYGNFYPYRFTTPQDYRTDLERRGFAIEGLEVISRTYRQMHEYFEFVVVDAIAPEIARAS
jgi:SAM-dependent methyltransferase